MAKKKIVKEPKQEEPKKYSGPRRSFRFLNPIGHADKYEWITLNKGDNIPAKIKPILDKEAGIKEQADRVEELEADLADDGKKNNSQDAKKKSPGRKSKKKGKSKK